MLAAVIMLAGLVRLSSQFGEIAPAAVIPGECDARISLPSTHGMAQVMVLAGGPRTSEMLPRCTLR